MPVREVDAGSRHEPDLLSGLCGAESLQAAGRSALAELLRQVLPPGLRPVCRLTRTKFKPGRKFTAHYALDLPGRDPAQVVLTWATQPLPPTHGPVVSALEEEASRHGLMEPFVRLAAASADGCVRILVSPVDPAFPQLVRLHDPGHLGRVIGAAVGTAGPAGCYRTQPIRYRPGERHVLALTSNGRPGANLVAKLYRDSTGRRATDLVTLLAPRLAVGGGDASFARPLGYVDSDQVALWAEWPGVALRHRLRPGRPVPGRLLASLGRAIRAMHAEKPATVPLDLPYHGLAAERAATERALEHLAVLAPAATARARSVAERVGELVRRLPEEPPRLTHGDLKCDNILVAGGRLAILDLDRAAFADPALDLGKFLADLRWWCELGGSDPGPAIRAFLDGYGEDEPGRIARARAIGALFDLKLAARRIAVHETGWEQRVEASVRRAESVVSAAEGERARRVSTGRAQPGIWMDPA